MMKDTKLLEHFRHFINPDLGDKENRSPECQAEVDLLK